MYTPYICAHLIKYFSVLNLEIVTSPTVDYIAKYGCNLILFLYIWNFEYRLCTRDTGPEQRLVLFLYC